LILSEDISFQPRQVGLSAKTKEVSKQEARDAPPVVSRYGEEGELGALRVVPSLCGKTSPAQQHLDAVLLRHHHQGRHPVNVDIRELFELGIRQLLLGAEKGDFQFCS
jgi:hypothetical protein